MVNKMQVKQTMNDTKKDDMLDGQNKLESTWHTLFKVDVQEEDIPYKNKKGVYTKEKACTWYRMFVDDFMEFEKNLHDIYNELWNAGKNDKLELRINSHGGLVNEGSQFYSIIKNKFNSRCTTVLDNCGHSMGALVFCMGDKRVITERAELMFHDYSTGLGGKGGEVEAQNKHSQVHVREFFREVILNQNFLTKKEFNRMLIGQDYWMGAKELCERGIATHVLYNSKEIKAKKYLKILKKGK